MPSRMRPPAFRRPIFNAQPPCRLLATQAASLCIGIIMQLSFRTWWRVCIHADQRYRSPGYMHTAACRRCWLSAHSIIVLRGPTNKTENGAGGACVLACPNNSAVFLTHGHVETVTANSSLGVSVCVCTCMPCNTTNNNNAIRCLWPLVVLSGHAHRSPAQIPTLCFDAGWCKWEYDKTAARQGGPMWATSSGDALREGWWMQQRNIPQQRSTDPRDQPST
eukprot:363192-Chlamydomonas_euryale.AAC.15